MSRELKQSLLELLEEKKRRETYNRFFYYYPDKDNLEFLGDINGKLFSREKYWKHLDFFKAGNTFKQRLFCAGNRVGKSFSGIYEVVCHATGHYPEWWQGKVFTRPVNIWIAGFSLKMMRDSVQTGLLGKRGDHGSGMIPQDSILRTRVAPGVPDAIETVDIQHKSGGFSTIAFKSYESGLEGFSGAAIDVIMLDEEPPLSVYTECLVRTTTTNGIVFVTFTPDRGFSDTVLSFFDGGNFREGQVGQKWVTVCGWDNAPHLDENVKKELWKSIPVHLRDAKTKGIPYLGSGAIYPILEEDIIEEPLKEIPDHWPRAYGLDIGWNRTAAVWGAYDSKGDTWHIYAEYYRGQAEPAVHSAAIKARGEWIPGVIDKASRGRSQIDGERLLDLYVKLGLDLIPSDKSKIVESGIQNVFDRFSTSRLKISKLCMNLLNEFRVYRRDDNGRIVKKDDHALDALRYLMDAGHEIAVPVPDDYDDKDHSEERHVGSEIGGY